MFKEPEFQMILAAIVKYENKIRGGVMNSTKAHGNMLYC